MSILENIRKRMEESKFCYAKEGGQGFVHESKCTCDKKNNPCQAKLDIDRFLKAFEDAKYSDHERRREILEEIRPEFKDSQWFNDNVKI